MIRCIRVISLEVAFELLILLKKYWYTYPKEKYGYKSYYTVIKNLIFRIQGNSCLVKSFNELYPKLLYANKISSWDERSLNERKYCLIWSKNNNDYTLVQDSFAYMGVQSLENKCMKADILPRVSSPSDKEKVYINLLEKCAKEIFKDFLEIDSIPKCNVIRNIKASVSGYASLYKLNKSYKNLYGHTFRYKVDSICIKEDNLKKESFSSALTIYIHELCHTFGGDKSESFSYAMTDVLEIILDNNKIIDKYNLLWRKV